VRNTYKRLMSRFNEKHVPDELQPIVERLRTERPEASGLELDEIKLRAMARAKDAQRLSRGKGQFMRSRLVGVVLAISVLGGGTGAMAVSGTGPGGVFKHHRHSLRSAPQSQYCPPKSQRPGKPKKPRPARCGKGPKP
jgi:hypothetical protein